MWSCKIGACGKTFQSRNSLSGHVSKNHQLTGVICVKCRVADQNHQCNVPSIRKSSAESMDLQSETSSTRPKVVQTQIDEPSVQTQIDKPSVQTQIDEPSVQTQIVETSRTRPTHTQRQSIESELDDNFEAADDLLDIERSETVEDLIIGELDGNPPQNTNSTSMIKEYKRRAKNANLDIDLPYNLEILLKYLKSYLERSKFFVSSSSVHRFQRYYLSDSSIKSIVNVSTQFLKFVFLELSEKEQIAASKKIQDFTKHLVDVTFDPIGRYTYWLTNERTDKKGKISTVTEKTSYNHLIAITRFLLLPTVLWRKKQIWNYC
jgi:hypothetical protein